MAPSELPIDMEPDPQAEAPKKGQRITLHWQGRVDGTNEGFEVNGMLAIGDSEGVTYITREQAAEFFGFTQSTQAEAPSEGAQPYSRNPFVDVRGKRMSELSAEQKDRAYEMWARNEIGAGWPLRDVFEAMFRVIDRLRADLATQQAVQGEPVAWRWQERGHWFDWTTDWAFHDKAKDLGVPIEYAYASTPPAPGQVEPVDVCTDPDNCQRCKAPSWDKHNHRHAGISSAVRSSDGGSNV